MLRVTINDRAYELPPGLMLLQAFGRLGIDVPHLCHDDRIEPTGSCRMCVVHVDGETRPVAACTTPVRDGMTVRTDTAQLQDLRRTLLGLMAEHYPADSVEREPDAPFHRYLNDYGVTPTNRLCETAWRDDTHPYIGVDMNRCIYCYRCVRICDELQGQFVWKAWERGDATRIYVATGSSLMTSECTSCGACADTCPSGALLDKQPQRLGAAQKWTTTTCVYCAVGCQMEVGSRGDRIVAVRPAYGAVNRGHLCVKGRYAFEFTAAKVRVTQPMLRRNGEWEQVGWDEALDYTADRLREIIERDGADAVGLLGSARATNEENYLMQKLARLAVGTNNVDCCARVCHTPSAAALKHMLGTGAATNSFDDIERAATIMICGANPAENHPIVGARIKQAVLRGATLIVIDPRRTELAEYADVHLAPLPGRNIPLFNAMACAILEEGLADTAFMTERVDGLGAYREHVRQFSPETVAPECGVPAEAIRAAARLYAGNKPAMCFHGLGVTEHTQGTEGVMTLINLALLTGNIGKPGSGINPLRGQNNVQGAAHMGCEPGTLTGGQSLAQARERFQQLWGGHIPERRGLSLPGMIDAAAAGRLKALWAFGYDIYQTLPAATVTAQSLGKLELLIVQDLFLNKTAEAFGTVFLPAASVFERDGTFMNSDRRVQHIRQVVPPPDQAKSDAWILCEIGRRLGNPGQFAFADAEAIWNEIRTVWPAGAGLSYQRLERESLHWPCPTETHPGTPVLHEGSFAAGPRAELAIIPYIRTAETTDRRYPFLLTTGRSLYHFNAGTMTGRTPNVELHAADHLEMTAEDAAALGLNEGARAVVTSRYGTTVLPVRISDQLMRGTLFTTFHDPVLFVNRITSPLRDRYVETPEYKVTAVAVNAETAHPGRQ